MDKGKHYLVGVFNDEDVLLHGVEHIREKGVRIEEVYTPFPVHGLDEALGYK
ncbi:MAG: quinol:electron acceptor oxidoreductase subunit ActD, partial [Cyclobacteriaceae bacterium]